MRDIDEIEDQDHLIITDECGSGSDTEWQCIECGRVEQSDSRPNMCPNCNCVDSDFGSLVNVYARRDAVGWFD